MACLAPNKLADGTEVACRECKLCQLKAKNDWVGRNIAESKTSKFCYIITATYGRGRVGEVLHERAVILTKSDVQKFMKLLRRHGYECRVFYTGEYGSERQRAHWNIILYSQKPLPSFSGWTHAGHWRQYMSYKRAFRWVRTDAQGKPVYLQSGEPAWWWPHGAVHVDEVNTASVKYVCKYVLKDFDANGRQGAKGQSKDPPLGTEWFRQVAEKYVEQGLAPQTPAYRFPESRTREGVVIDYWLKGRPLEMYLDHYIATWAASRPGQRRPPSQLVDLYEQYGKVVNDENRMLVREQFPEGEGLAPFKVPSRDEMEPQREERLFRKAFAEWKRNGDPDEGWFEKWVRDAADEQERQERKRQYDNHDWRRLAAFLAQWGRAWELGRGVFRTESAQSGDEGDVQSDQVRSGAPASPSGVGVRPDYGLGKIGRVNRDYGGTD